jgi:hypothetical protein
MTTDNFWWKDWVTMDVRYKVAGWIVEKNNCPFFIPSINWGKTWDVNPAVFCTDKGDAPTVQKIPNSPELPEATRTPSSSTTPAQNTSVTLNAPQTLPFTTPNGLLYQAAQANNAQRFGAYQFTIEECKQDQSDSKAAIRCSISFENGSDKDIKLCIESSKTRMVTIEGSNLGYWYSGSSGGGIGCSDRYATDVFYQTRISLEVGFYNNGISKGSKAIQVVDFGLKINDAQDPILLRFTGLPIK